MAFKAHYTETVTPPTDLVSCAVDSCAGRGDSAWFVYTTPAEAGNDSIRVRISTSAYGDSSSYTISIPYAASTTDSVKVATGGTPTYTFYASSWVWDATNLYSARCQANRTISAAPGTKLTPIMKP
jgi:hypothetical protein